MLEKMFAACGFPDGHTPPAYEQLLVGAHPSWLLQNIMMTLSIASPSFAPGVY